MGRQNGKSQLACAYQLLILLHFHAPLLISVASSADQARIVYQRLSTVIDTNPAIRSLFTALTDTRGIKKADGGRVEIKASKGQALQGLAIRAGLVDELHITTPEVWNSLVSGLGGRLDSQVFGITTAGDADSELLHHLYKLAEDPPNSFGYAIWEASSAAIPEDDSDLATSLKQANPAIASGRVDVSRIIETVRTLPEQDAIRYHLNRFVLGGPSVFMELGRWSNLATSDLPSLTRPVYGVDKSPDGNWASIVAAQRIDGITYTELVATLQSPDLKRLTAICQNLPNPAAFVLNGWSMRELGSTLAKSGNKVELIRSAEECTVSGTLFHLIATEALQHAGDPLITLQMQGAVRKNVGDRWKISKSDSSRDIDALYATAYACHYAEIYEDSVPQLFI